MSPIALSSQQRRDLTLLWDYHQLRHDLRPCSAAVALGGFDISVARYSAKLFTERYFPLIVFTGGTSPTTSRLFPQGEALAFRDHARSLGVPDEAILVEPDATNTGENVTFSRELLRLHAVPVTDIMAICMPSMQRRAYATFAKQWPDVSVSCASEPTTIFDYLAAFGNDRSIIDELVGDTQRIWRHAAEGFATEQPIPEPLVAAYNRLVRAGFSSKVLP